MMKKMLLVVLTVLAMATVANAALTAKISVNGVVDPPDTSIILLPSETVIIDIHAWNNVSVSSSLLVMQGPGLLSKGQMWLWEQSTFTMPSVDFAGWKEFLEGLGYMGITQIADLDIQDLVENPYLTPNGLVLDGLVFHCEAVGDVTLSVFDLDGNVLDSQVIHQIPEPITMVLLGLGGLFLRRRK
jgi:hypothetical protein